MEAWLRMLVRVLVIVGAVLAEVPGWAQTQPRARWVPANIAAEAKRLAVGPQAGWFRVVRLAPGTQIVITRRAQLPEPRRFLVADDAELVVLNADYPGLPRNVRRVLLQMASERVDYARLFRGELFFNDHKVHVAADGVFAGNQKIVETAEVIVRIRRADVLVVAEPPKKRGTALGAIIGGAGGFLIGFGLAVAIATENQCGASCNDEEALMALSVVGIPIAGGVLGYHAVSRTTQSVIYEAPEGR
jgi:hypothetical protein